jgi:hypothetical protein
LREEHRQEIVREWGGELDIGPKKDEVTGGQRRLHNEEFCYLFSSLNILCAIKSRRMRWADHVARYGDSRVAYRGLVGRREGMMPPGRPRDRWEDNFKMNQEVGWGIDWIDLVQGRDRWRAVVRTFRFHKCGEFLECLRKC